MPGFGLFLPCLWFGLRIICAGIGFTPTFSGLCDRSLSSSGFFIATSWISWWTGSPCHGSAAGWLSVDAYFIKWLCWWPYYYLIFASSVIRCCSFAPIVLGSGDLDLFLMYTRTKVNVGYQCTIILLLSAHDLIQLFSIHL